MKATGIVRRVDIVSPKNPLIWEGYTSHTASASYNCFIRGMADFEEHIAG